MPDLVKNLKAKIDGKKHEADLVLRIQIWEVKPLNGQDPKPQFELYKKVGNLELGERLETISGVTVLGDVK